MVVLFSLLQVQETNFITTFIYNTVHFLGTATFDDGEVLKQAIREDIEQYIRTICLFFSLYRITTFVCETFVVGQLTLSKREEVICRDIKFVNFIALEVRSSSGRLKSSPAGVIVEGYTRATLTRKGTQVIMTQTWSFIKCCVLLLILPIIFCAQSTLGYEVTPKRVSPNGGSLLYIHYDIKHEQAIDIGSHEIFLGKTPCDIEVRKSAQGFAACRVRHRTPGDASEAEFVVIRDRSNARHLASGSIALSVEIDSTLAVHGDLDADTATSQDAVRFMAHRNPQRRRLIKTETYVTQLSATIGGVHAHCEMKADDVVEVIIPTGVTAGLHTMEITHDVVGSHDRHSESSGKLVVENNQLLVLPSIQYVNRVGPKEYHVYGSNFALDVNAIQLFVHGDKCHASRVDFHVIEAVCDEVITGSTTHDQVSGHGIPFDVRDLPFEYQPDQTIDLLHDSFEKIASNIKLSSLPEHIYVTPQIEWPGDRPTHKDGLRFASYMAQTSKGDAVSFEAPYTAAYDFIVQCSALNHDGICAMDLGEHRVTPSTPLKNINLVKGQRFPFTALHVRMSSSESFKVLIAIRKLDTMEEIHSTREPAPAAWFRWKHESPLVVNLKVNDVQALCKSSRDKSCSPVDVIQPPKYHEYFVPIPDIPQPAAQSHQRRDLATIINWSSYAATCGLTCVIPSGTRVLLDTSMDVTSLTIQGELVWDTTKSNLVLSAGFAVCEDGGNFTLGTALSPMLFPATIYIKNNGASHVGLGARSFGGHTSTPTRGSNVMIYGKPLAKTWTLLTATANVGATSIQVADASMGWSVGDRIAISPTTLPVTSAAGAGYAEAFDITSISGSTITLSGSLTEKKLGDAVKRFQAEVINLSRNVKITGDAFDVDNRGLHTVLFGQGGTMTIAYTRVERAGQRGLTGKYPLHFHNVKNCNGKCVFRGNAVEDSHQRGIIIHATHRSLVTENVLFRVRGAGLYVEDGNEMENIVSYNVVLCHDGTQDRMNCRAPGTDNTQADDVQQSGAWVLSPSNDFIGNRLVNQYNAFFMQTSAFPFGRGFSAQKVCAIHSQFGRFSKNVCHSNWRFGWYPDNSMPRNLLRSVATDGFVSDMPSCGSAWCSCQEFGLSGQDNGLIGIVEDEFDWFNDFVGQYELGDVSYVNYRGVNNLKNMYWKHTKPFADGVSSHLKNCTIGWDSSTNMPGVPGSGVAGVMGPGGLGAFIVDRCTFFGSAVEGQLAANQHCQVAGTGALVSCCSSGAGGRND